MAGKLNVHLDDERQIATVEGIRYSYELFRDFARQLPEHQPFTITKREDGCLTITKSPDPRLMALVEHVEGLMVAGNNVLFVKATAPPDHETIVLLRQQLAARCGFRGVIYCIPSDWTVEKLTPKEGRALLDKLQMIYGRPSA